MRGDFAMGARFGARAVTEAIYARYYGKIIGVSWFNGGAPSGTAYPRHDGHDCSGHEERLPPSRLSDCYRFGQETFARTHGNGRSAPIAAIPRPSVK
jgi:hypothetical protein